MPRLSLWNPKKGNDYKFMDNTILEQFNVGGTGAIIHKYRGPEESPDQNDPTQPLHINQDIPETSVQDLLFLETRDRRYDTNMYELRGVYNVSDNDFDLTQFGLFLTNDVLYMTFHLGEMVRVLGRKMINGDVIELPHLLEEYTLDPNSPPIPKFYIVQDGNRGGEGFSAVWWPHIWRVKIGPIVDSQEFDGIIGNANEDDSLKEYISTYNAELNIRDSVVQSASQNDPGGGIPLTDHLYNYITEEERKFWTGDVVPIGTAFPASPNSGDFFIRTDFVPNRLFVYRDNRWIRLLDNISSRTWSENTFNAGTFINNDRINANSEGEYRSRQSINRVILPKPDFRRNTGGDFDGEFDIDSFSE